MTPIKSLLECSECIVDALDLLPSNEFDSNATVVATNLMKSMGELKVVVFTASVEHNWSHIKNTVFRE